MNKIEFNSNEQTLVANVCGDRAHFVLVHAGGENKEVWQPVQERLAMAGLGSVAYDQRGHGESTGSLNEKIECLSNDLRHVLAVHTGPKILVGASLGGLASIVALQDKNVQSHIGGLVMVDVVPTPDRDRTIRFLKKTAPHLVQSTLLGDIFGKKDLLLQAASKVNIPILLVRAGQTGPIVNDDVFRFRELCPQLTVAHVDTSGHLIARDAPLQLASILLHFEQSPAVRKQTAFN